MVIFCLGWLVFLLMWVDGGVFCLFRALSWGVFFVLGVLKIPCKFSFSDGV